MTPEQRLAVNVILLAVQDAHSRTKLKGWLDKRQQRLAEKEAERWRDDARRWIWSDESGPWSFLWCCSHTGMDPRRLRARMDHPSVRALVANLKGGK